MFQSQMKTLQDRDSKMSLNLKFAITSANER